MTLHWPTRVRSLIELYWLVKMDYARWRRSDRGTNQASESTEWHTDPLDLSLDCSGPNKSPMSQTNPGDAYFS